MNVSSARGRVQAQTPSPFQLTTPNSHTPNLDSSAARLELVTQFGLSPVLSFSPKSCQSECMPC